VFLPTADLFLTHSLARGRDRIWPDPLYAVTQQLINSPGMAVVIKDSEILSKS